MTPMGWLEIFARKIPGYTRAVQDQMLTATKSAAFPSTDAILRYDVSLIRRVLEQWAVLTRPVMTSNIFSSKTAGAGRCYAPAVERGTKPRQH